MKSIPSVKFKTRVRDRDSKESNPYIWKDVSRENILNFQKIISEEICCKIKL